MVNGSSIRGRSPMIVPPNPIRNDANTSETIHIASRKSRSGTNRLLNMRVPSAVGRGRRAAGNRRKKDGGETLRVARDGSVSRRVGARARGRELALRLLALARDGFQIGVDLPEVLIRHLAVHARHDVAQRAAVRSLVLAKRGHELLFGPIADADGRDIRGSGRRTAAAGEVRAVARAAPGR